LTDYSENIPQETLLSYQAMGFKLIPLAQDAKTPTVKTTNEIYVDPKYWTAEKIETENYRFKNVATTFGITNIKDEEGGDLYLNECDVDSKEAFDRLAIVKVKDKDYFFIDEMCKITYVVKTKKKYGYRFYWLSHKQYLPIGTKDCKLGHEFEIKTDNTLGHGTLPPSRHRDDPNFHYRSMGQNAISIQDGLYDGILNKLTDCLKTKNERQQQNNDSNTYHDINNNNSKIILTDNDIEQIVYLINDFYQRHSRHDIVFGFSGYLYKNDIVLESAEKIIILLCQLTNDEEKSSRITVLHNTYSNGQSGNKTIGYAQLLAVLTRISDAQTATQILDNISQVLKK
jgi:hypothetical protein